MNSSDTKLNEKMVLTLEDLMQILPFCKSKILRLARLNLLPVVKVGKDYITSPKLIEEWLEENVGSEIVY